jgi:hypothetical protein
LFTEKHCAGAGDLSGGWEIKSKCENIGANFGGERHGICVPQRQSRDKSELMWRGHEVARQVKVKAKILTRRAKSRWAVNRRAKESVRYLDPEEYVHLRVKAYDYFTIENK